MPNVRRIVAVASFVAMTASVPAAAGAQEKHDHEPAAPPDKTAAPACRMMQQHDAGAAADTVADLVAEMKASTGDARTEAMAALLERLAAQQAAPQEAGEKKMCEMCEAMKKGARKEVGHDHP